ncbi:thiopeptide-type bacteriocin biosynthesis protein, partial [Actinomadura adrarensis]
MLNAQHRADLLRLAEDPGRLCDVLTEIGLGPQIEVTEASDLTMRLDLTDDAQREWFVRRLRRDTRLRLHECLPVSTPVWSDLGGHVHDVWVPWVRREPRVNPPMSRSRMVERIPVAEPAWTSWYVYAPDRVVEMWLARPQQVAMMDRGELFFMRYRDERPHLRIRIRSEHATEALLAGLQGHLAAMVPQQAYEITTRPYVPEDHRYGGPARRADTLRLFCADSA